MLQDHSTGKTRVLVTHALHFLPQVDFIYTIVEGHIAEQGTYAELMSNDGAFSKFIKEFGSKEQADEKEEEAVVDDAADEKKPEAHKHETHGPGMMQAEERNTGAISRDVYKEYLRAGKGPVLVPLLLFSLVLIQATTVMSSYWFVCSFLHSLLVWYSLVDQQACLLARTEMAATSSFLRMALFISAHCDGADTLL